MNRIHDSDDDDDDYARPSPFSQTQRFTKSGTLGSKDLKTTQSKHKPNEMSSLKLDLNRIHDDHDSLNDSDDDSNSKTGRSTSSATTSQLTPKPKERSFLRSNTDKPKVPPRHIDIDEDDRNVFGQTTMKPSPRHHISTLKEDEQRDQSFAHSFRSEKKPQSPTDMFSADHRSGSPRGSRKSPKDYDEREHHGSDDETFLSKQTKPNKFEKSRHSPTEGVKSQSRKNSSRSREGTDQSDNDDNEHLSKQPKRQDYTKKRQSNHDLTQASPKETDSNAIQHQSSSSRPGSAGKKEVESTRRSSHFEDKETVIPPITSQKSPSRPTSAKSNTTRQQTQSAIDNVISANAPPALDPLTSNNEALAETFRPSSPPPRTSARRPPLPKPAPSKATTGGAHHKKGKFVVPAQYRKIGAAVDTGRAPITPADLKKSFDREIQRELKSQTLVRPQSSRVRQQSANSTMNTSRRRRSSSAYEHVRPRVNTNLSVNFDELNTSQMRAESSQSIKDGVYLEWLKAKEDQRKFEKEDLKRQQEDIARRVNQTQIEGKIRQQAQSLETWRRTKDDEIRKKKQEENQLRREAQEKKEQAEKEKKKNAKDGFANWAESKEDVLKSKANEEREKKAEIEKRQEEKRAKFLNSEEKVAKWMKKKSEHLKAAHDAKKTVRDGQLKTIRQEEETKFVSAQEAYEKWLKDKDKYEIDEKSNTRGRNSLSGQQPQVPFLPGGSQKNTGKIPHVIW